jgi:large subunit ribosomal protein L17
VSGTKFNVDKDHRASLLRNLLNSYILNGQMVTTEAKAKALKQAFDKLVTRAKKNDLVSRRMVAQMVTQNEAVEKLFNEIMPKLVKKTSGFSTTEIIEGERAGDSARMMRIKMLTE